MVCKKCGCLVNSDDNFCTNCGKNLDKEGKILTKEKKEVNTNNKNKLPGWVIVIIIVLALFVIFYLIAPLLPFLIFVFSSSAWIKDDAIYMIDSVKGYEQKQNVYYLEQLEDEGIFYFDEMDDYDDSSYVSYDGNKYYVCLSDGDKKASGYEGEIEIKNDETDCHYSNDNTLKNHSLDLIYGSWNNSSGLGSYKLNSDNTYIAYLGAEEDNNYCTGTYTLVYGKEVYYDEKLSYVYEDSDNSFYTLITNQDKCVINSLEKTDYKESKFTITLNKKDLNDITIYNVKTHAMIHLIKNVSFGNNI